MDKRETVREEITEVRRNVTIGSQETIISERMLSSLSFQCVMQYINVHKRLMMSICNRQIQTLEKMVPLYISDVSITPSNIKLDDIEYVFGEILEIGESSEQKYSCWDVTAKDIHVGNLHGGMPWESSEDDIPELGDLQRGTGSCGLQDYNKRKSQELRRCFLASLEKYLNSEENFNPMDLFERSVTSKRELWPLQFSQIFEVIRGFSSINIRPVYSEYSIVNYEDVKDDELSDMYPKAIKLMKSRLEKMINLGDIRSHALKKLVFPLPTVPNFNQFSIFKNSLTMDYSIRLPDGLSIRRAVKNFSTRILGGRRKIRVGKLDFWSSGIFPLPVGLKLDCKQFGVHFRSRHDIMPVYNKVVRRADNIFVMMFPGETRFFQMSVIQNCKTLQIHQYLPLEGGAGLCLLDNELLCLGIKSSPIDTCFTIISDWMKKNDRRIGSKLLIAFDKETCQGDIREIVSSSRLLNKRFRRAEGKELFYLPLNKIKRLDITLKEDKHPFSERFLEKLNFDFYCHVEIVSF